MNRSIVVLITAKNKTQARKIAQGLLKDRLMACANIIEGVESMFLWQGKIDKASEVLLIIKTHQKVFDKLVAKVKLLHSYQTPEIIALPVVQGSEDYLKWIEESVS